MDLGLAGRGCVVIGAGRGIGRETARMLCAEGANVLLVAVWSGVVEREHQWLYLMALCALAGLICSITSTLRRSGAAFSSRCRASRLWARGHTVRRLLNICRFGMVQHCAR